VPVPPDCLIANNLKLPNVALAPTLLNPVFRTALKKIDFGLGKEQRTFFSYEREKIDFSLQTLRGFFNKRDLKGLYVIEKFVQEQESEYNLQFINLCFN
jgi:hypothetical protein